MNIFFYPIIIIVSAFDFLFLFSLIFQSLPFLSYKIVVVYFTATDIVMYMTCHTSYCLISVVNLALDLKTIIKSNVIDDTNLKDIIGASDSDFLKTLKVIKYF